MAMGDAMAAIPAMDKTAFLAKLSPGAIRPLIIEDAGRMPGHETPRLVVAGLGKLFHDARETGHGRLSGLAHFGQMTAQCLPPLASIAFAWQSPPTKSQSTAQ